MGGSFYIKMIKSIDRKIVLKKWKEIVLVEDKNALKKIIREMYKNGDIVKRGNKYVINDNGFPAITKEIKWEWLANAGVPSSFDDGKYVYINKKFNSVGHIKKYMADAHQKYSPAFAIEFKGKTYIGGWVSE